MGDDASLAREVSCNAYLAHAMHSLGTVCVSLEGEVARGKEVLRWTSEWILCHLISACMACIMPRESIVLPGPSNMAG